MAKKRKISKVLVIIICVILFALAWLLGEAIVLLQNVKTLKAELPVAYSCVKSNDIDGLSESFSDISDSAESIDKVLSMPHWWLISKAPVVGGDVASVRTLVSVLNTACEDCFTPALDTLEEYPLSNLKVDGGFNAETVIAYVDLLCDLMPNVEDYCSELSNLSFNLLPSEYSSLIAEATTFVSEYSDYATVVKNAVGSGEDKVYLILAQNAAETRASGGFPGSVGMIRIEDGVLSVGDFQPVNNVLPLNNSPEYTSTANEFKLFSYWVQYPRDMCYNPNFERIAYIIAKNYEVQNDEKVDGIIAMTPVVIQEILGEVGSITLSDGTILNGTNATKFLQRDIYFKYLVLDESDNTYHHQSVADDLFSETASKTLDLVFSNLNVSSLLGYLDIYQEGVEERVIELWFSDDDTEQLIKDLGASGGLTTDKDEPAVGVYFSCSDPSKLGWFLGIDTLVSTPTENADGTRTYKVTVTLNNYISEEERMSVGTYILGQHDGDIVGNIHLFAPTGGTISDIESSDNYYFYSGEYEGLECKYFQGITIEPDTPITLTFTVTTAPGVTTPLEVMKTPTIN